MATKAHPTTTRLRTAELGLVRAAAAHRGMSQSEFLRQAALEAASRDARAIAGGAEKSGETDGRG